MKITHHEGYQSIADFYIHNAREGQYIPMQLDHGTYEQRIDLSEILEETPRCDGKTLPVSPVGSIP
jgi:hypothetical protein